LFLFIDEDLFILIFIFYLEILLPGSNSLSLPFPGPFPSFNLYVLAKYFRFQLSECSGLCKLIPLKPPRVSLRRLSSLPWNTIWLCHP